jgi:hypothetical protein
MALLLKTFPDDFSNDVGSILKAMSFGDGMILVGTAGIRSQLYAGDYDGFEQVHVTHLSNTIKKFQSIISHLKNLKNVYIGDIKAGIVPQWDILKDIEYKDGKILGYDRAKILASLKQLKDTSIISNAEYKAAAVLLKPNLSPGDYFVAKDEIKFHVVRWTPSDVLHGHTTLRNQGTYTLAEAFTSPAIAKIDVISRVANNRFSEFSVVYEFYKDKQILNPTRTREEIGPSLLESIAAYTYFGNYFKVIKRIFSLARWEKNKETIAKLEPILNGDLGRLYIIISDIDTLEFMLERYNNLPEDAIRFEIDQFINRLSNVSLPPLVGKQPTLNKMIRHIEKLSLSKMAEPLEDLKTILYKLLQHYAKPIADALTPVTLSGGGGESPAEWGPRVWRFLHIIAAHNDLPELREAFKVVVRRMTCPACRIHTSDYLMEHPLKEPTDRYVWEFHNEVNKRLGKPIFPFEDLSRYKVAAAEEPKAPVI